MAAFPVAALAAPAPVVAAAALATGCTRGSRERCHHSDSGEEEGGGGGWRKKRCRKEEAMEEEEEDEEDEVLDEVLGQERETHWREF